MHSLSYFGLSENRFQTWRVDIRNRILKTLHDARSQALRNRLRATRDAAGLTQSDLAHRLGKPQSYVSKFEIGERRLDVIEYAEICAALGLDPACLLADVLRAGTATATVADPFTP